MYGEKILEIPFSWPKQQYVLYYIEKQQCALYEKLSSAYQLTSIFLRNLESEGPSPSILLHHGCLVFCHGHGWIKSGAWSEFCKINR